MAVFIIRVFAVFFCLLTTVFTAEKPYVTCNFAGQLGNQLFQAAAAIAYARDHQSNAIFPTIQQAIGGAINYQHVFHRLNTALPSSAKRSFYDYYEHLHTHYTIFSPIFHQEGMNIRLNGFFQTERYFIHHADYIREIFSPSPDILVQIHRKYGELLKNPTVGIHVRTFITDGRNPQIVGIGGASWNYFLRAIQCFPEHFHFLIFSDAIEWTKKHFPPCNRAVTFIEGNPHYIDFYLLSLCQHQIISPESTFSWWAAWLNRNIKKVVIAPNTWSGREDNETIPKEWIKIPIQ